MHKLIAATLVALTPALLLASSHDGDGLHTCPARFDGYVTEGPDAGFSFGGALTFSVGPSGHAHGILHRDDGIAVEVNGRVDRVEIALTFEGMHVSGTGTTDGDFSACVGHSGGDLRGPRRGDAGDWGIIWGS